MRILVRSRLSRQWLWLVLSALVGCAGKPPPMAMPATPALSVELSPFLIGDGGAPEKDGEPVLHALAAAVGATSAPALVVFLGDNVYPAGLVSPQSPKRAEAERRLEDQIDSVLRTQARAVFVPGNHDWDNSGDDGWNAVRRQEAFINERGDSGRVVQLPAGGCPGPHVVDAGPLRLIALDTQWWLYDGEKPGAAHCAAGTEEAILDALQQSLAGAGERVSVVVAHHPLVSSGPHGGYFNWQDHLFPLTRVWAPLWIPLPIVGSGYPLARRAGVSAQDMSGSENERMRSALEGVFASNPPLIYAAGHEHSLEVLRGETVPFLVVSGTGYYGHTSPTRWRSETLCKNASAGFVRLDVLRDGRLRLGVLNGGRRGEGVGSLLGLSSELGARD